MDEVYSHNADDGSGWMPDEPIVCENVYDGPAPKVTPTIVGESFDDWHFRDWTHHQPAH